MNHNEQTPSKDTRDAVGRLLELAGNPDPVPAERLARSRETVRAHWQQQIAPRSRPWMQGLALAAVLVLAIGATVLLGGPGGHGVATFTGSTGELALNGVLLTPGSTLDSGQTLETGTVRASFQWSTGHSLRLDRNTRIEALDSDRLALLDGRIYVDSGFGPRQSTPLIVDTPLGPVRDIGTQFEVTARSGELTVRVREGLVEVLATRTKPLSVEAGYRVDLAAGTEVRQVPIKKHGDDWEWAFEAAPAFELEGRSLDEFLRWISRENGWELEYDSLRTRRTAEDSRLHGSIDGLSAEDALNSVLRTYGFAYRIESGTLRIGGSPEKG